MSLKLFTRGHAPDSQTFQFKVWLYFASGRPGWRPVESGRDFTLRPMDIDTLSSPMTTSRHGKRSTSFRRRRPARNKNRNAILKSLLDSAEHRTVPLSMNRPFGVPALAGSDRLKAELQTSGVPTGRFMVRMQISQERHWS